MRLKLRDKVLAMFMIMVVVLGTILPSYAVNGNVKTAEDASDEENDNDIIESVELERKLNNDWGSFNDGEEIPNGTDVRVNLSFKLDNEYDKNTIEFNIKHTGFTFKALSGIPLRSSSNEKVGTWSLTEDGHVTINLDESFRGDNSDVTGNLTLDGNIEVDDENNGEPVDNYELSVDVKEHESHRVKVTFPEAVGKLKVVKSTFDINENGECEYGNEQYDSEGHIVTYTVFVQALDGYVNDINFEDVYDDEYLEFYETKDSNGESQPVFYGQNNEEYVGFEALRKAIKNSVTQDEASLAKDQKFIFRYKMKVLDELYKSLSGNANNTITVSGENIVGDIEETAYCSLHVDVPSVHKRFVSEENGETKWRIEIRVGEFKWENVSDGPFTDRYEETNKGSGEQISSLDTEIKKEDFINDENDSKLYYYEYSIPKSEEAKKIEQNEPVTYSNSIDNVNISGTDYKDGESKDSGIIEREKLDKTCIESESTGDLVSWEVTFSNLNNRTDVSFKDELVESVFTDDTFSTYIVINKVKAIYIHDGKATVTEKGKKIIKSSWDGTWDNVVMLGVTGWPEMKYTNISFTFDNDFIANNPTVTLKYKTKKDSTLGGTEITYKNTVTLTSTNGLNLTDTATYVEHRYDTVHKNMVSNTAGNEGIYSYNVYVDVYDLIQQDKLHEGDTITLTDVPDSVLGGVEVKGVCITPLQNKSIDYSLCRATGNDKKTHPMGFEDKEQIYGSPAYDGKIRDDKTRFEATEKDGNIIFKITFDKEMIETIQDTYGKENIHPSLYIEYTLKVKNFYELFAKAGGNQSITLVNKIKGTMSDNLNIGNSSAITYATVPQVLNKTMKYGNETAPDVNFTIDIPYQADGNPSGDRLILEDTMGSSLMLVDKKDDTEDSIKVEKLDEIGNVIEDGKLNRRDDLSESELTKNDYSVKYDSLNNKIIFNVPDNTRLRISYVARTCLIEGETITFDNMGNTITEPISGASASNISDIYNSGHLAFSPKGYVIGENGKVNLVKYYIDAAGNRTRIGNTKFEIYEAEFVDDQFTYDESSYKYDVSIDKEGNDTECTGLVYDKIYALKEVETDERLEVREEPLYFAIPGTSWDKLQGREKLDFVLDGGYVRFENEKKDVEVTISKVSADDESKKISGAVLQILDKDNNVIEQWTTDGSDHIISDKLVVGDEYILHEVSAPEGYMCSEDITFSVDSSDKEEGSDIYRKSIVMKDETTKVTIKKVDSKTKKEIAGATLEIYDSYGELMDSWTTKENESHNVNGILKTEEQYTLVETSAPDGYELAEDIEFSIGKDGTVMVDGTAVEDGIICMEDLNTKADIKFTKVGRYNELFASNYEETELLPGVTFDIRKESNPDEVIKTAVSDENGVVTFDLMDKGRYIIKETNSGYDNYMLNETEFIAELTEDGDTILMYPDGSRVQDNKVINDVYRGNIEFTKVNELQPDEKIANSTYGLFRRADSYAKNLSGNTYDKASINTPEGVSGTIADGADIEVIDGVEYVKIAEATTNSEGKIQFEGAIVGVDYIVKELKAPNGYYISQNAITVKLSVDENKHVNMSLVEDGAGTVSIDDNGNITWLEPVIVAEFSKVDENGNMLAGARLHIEDKNGEIVKDEQGNKIEWISSEEPFKIEGILVCGETYKLVETVAPDGYELAEPIQFSVGNTASANETENNLIRITMVDNKTIVNEEKTDKNDEILDTEKEIITDNEPNEFKIKTGDSILCLFIILMIATLLLIFAIVRKHKLAFHDKNQKK